MSSANNWLDVEIFFSNISQSFLDWHNFSKKGLGFMNNLSILKIAKIFSIYETSAIYLMPKNSFKLFISNIMKYWSIKYFSFLWWI